jgi:2-aminoethylphosphonate-pyruvate transaminase
MSWELSEKTMTQISASKDKILFTPGPLTTSRTVKQAMLQDLGSRDQMFIDMVRSIRKELLLLGDVNHPDYTAVLMQGSGTFCLEATLSTVIPSDGKLLVCSNGAYGKRLVKMASILKIPTLEMACAENTPVSARNVEQALQDKSITHVAVVHCETTTGIMNPIAAIGEVVTTCGRSFVVDAMSSFGAVPINLAACHIDYLISSANKCIEGVPGFGFVLANTSKLAVCEGQARSLSLDLHAQWRGLETDGQFRFTPPTHALLAFAQALQELHDEGGIEARAKRYQDNYQTLVKGMQQLGFETYLNSDDQGYIITSFRYPAGFHFEKFYQALSERGYVIYPGKVSNADCFRIGNIGRIFTSDVCSLLAAIKNVMEISYV